MHWRKIERLRVTDHQFKVDYERQRVFFVAERTEDKVRVLIIREQKTRESWDQSWAPDGHHVLIQPINLSVVSWSQWTPPILPPPHCNVTLYCLDLLLCFSPRDDLFPYVLQHFPVLMFTLCSQGGGEVDQKSLKLVQVPALPIIHVIVDKLLNNSKNNLFKAKDNPDTGRAHLSHTILHLKSEKTEVWRRLKYVPQVM